MTKRVFEVAREYGVETKEVVTALQKQGIKVSNFSGVDDDLLVKLEHIFARKNAPAAAAKPAAAEKPAPAQTRTVHIQQNNNNRYQQNGNNRPQQGGNNNRPQQGGNNNRPQQGNNNRPQQGSNNRPQQGNNNRPQQGNNNRPQQGNNNRPQQGNHNRPQQGSNNRPQQGSNNRYQQGGNRPQQGSGNRPQQGSNNRPQQGGTHDNGQRHSSQRPNQGNTAANHQDKRNFRQDGPRQDKRNTPGEAAKQDKDKGKRTRYFGQPQQGGDAAHTSQQHNNHSKDKHGQSNFRDKNHNQNNKNGARPHTLLSSVLNKGKKSKGHKNNQEMQNMEQMATKAKKYPTEIEIPESITVKALAEKMGREVSEIIKKLMMGGIMASINQEIDFDTASLVADEFGITVTMEAPPEDPTEIEEIIDDPATMKIRPPVVTIMGHVDHGKTSLLDAIRQSHVQSGEAGGITQHIGAYQVRYNGKKIVFMDTPGHEAFTAMRARGAQVTDIAVLVVAADDGVMPQTIESINHAKSAGVPIIVAINKIDKEGANPELVKQQLTEYGLVGEEWGGDTIMVPVSAHKKIGLEDLLENILVLAEVSELKANPNRAAQGVVIEARLDKGRGPVASVLVQKGTLHVGDSIIAGACYGKVRAMTNERGERMKKAEPSIPVEILGLNDVPEAGDMLDAVDEKIARSVAEKRLEKKRTSELHQHQKVTLDDLFNQIQQGELKELSLIVKGDVQGSVEALSQSLMSIKNDEVRITIVHAGVGAITESDVMLASASNALIIGFNVRPDAAVRKMAEHEDVDMRTYRVIYDAINDVEAAMKGMLEKKMEEKILGRVQVRKVINTPKFVVAGSYVTEGKITSGSQIRLLRNGIVVHEGEVDSLRRFKDDVKEVAEGYECGITLEGYRDVKEGDEIEAYVMVEVDPE